MIDKVVDLGIAVAYYLTLGEQQHEDVRWVRRATQKRNTYNSCVSQPALERRAFRCTQLYSAVFTVFLSVVPTHWIRYHGGTVLVLGELLFGAAGGEAVEAAHSPNY